MHTDAETRAHYEWNRAAVPGGVSRMVSKSLIAVMERPLHYYGDQPDRQCGQRRSMCFQEVWIKALRGIRKLKDPGRCAHGSTPLRMALAVDRHFDKLSPAPSSELLPSLLEQKQVAFADHRRRAPICMTP